MSLSLQLKPNSGHCGDFAAATMISARCGSIVDNPEVPTFRPESEHLHRNSRRRAFDSWQCSSYRTTDRGKGPWCGFEIVAAERGWVFHKST